jgi:putative transcriptional regulator
MENTIQTIAAITQVPDYTPAVISRLMRRHDLNEQGLAVLVNVTPSTVRLWLLGEVRPCALSRRMLQFIDTCPEIIDVFIERKTGA